MENQHSNAISVSMKLPNQKEDVTLNLVQSSSAQILSDVLQFSSPARCLTNLDLYFKGTKLTGEEALKDLATGDTLKLDVKYRPYTTRDALRHITVVRDTIGFASEAQDGVSDFAVSTGIKFADLPLHSVKSAELKKSTSGDEKNPETEKTESAAFNLSEQEASEFQQTVKDILTENKPVADILKTRSPIVTPCVRSLNLSAYNPAPAFYRSKGHLLYLQVVTLEGESFHITASTAGFYVNRSNSNKFDPNRREDASKTFVSLLDLLSFQSKKFNEHVKKLEQKISALDNVCIARPSTTFLCKPWLVSTSPSASGSYSRFQLSESDFNTERNFNDEFQAIKDMTTGDFQSIVDTEKLTAKVYHEFTEAAVRDSMSIFYDDLVPMNPEADTQEQIFLKNNIFYSFVGDVNGNYTSIGGDAAAFAASNQDLQTVKLLHRVTLSEIHYLLCAVIDFAGRRVLAQTPVPGLLSAMGTVTKQDPKSGETVTEDLNSDVNVVYGLDESTGEILYNEEFDDALESFSRLLHLEKHQVGSSQIKISSHSKGIVGSDKRKYVLDLANSHPLDVKFARQFYDNADESNRYPHRQTLIRNELVDKWWATKIENVDTSFEKAFEEKLFAFNPDAYVVSGVEDPLVDEISDYLANEVVPGVVEDYAAGNSTAPYDGDHLSDSLHKNGINMRYLGQVIKLAEAELKKQESKHEEKLAEVKLGNEDHENWEKEYLVKVEQLIKERQAKINALIQEGKDIPEDLKGNLKLDENDIRKPTKGEAVAVNRDQLLCLVKISQLEVAARSMKHVLRKYAKSLPVPVVSSLVTYFFNLLFGHNYNPQPKAEIIDEFYSQSAFPYMQVSRADLLKEIREQARLRFIYDISDEVLESLCEQRFALIRAVSKKFGIQVLNKEYYFTQDSFENFKQSQDKKVRSKLNAPSHTFSAGDLAIIPVIKDGEYKSLSGDNFWTQGASILSEKEEEGLVLLRQALTIKEEVNGIVHPSVAESYMALSTIYHTLNRVPEAVTFCRKACAIYERVCGVDSFEVIRCLMNLAILEISNKCPFNGAHILQRILDTLNALCVAVHPATINAYTMLQQASLASKNAKLAIEIMKKLSETILVIEGGEHTLAFGYNQSRIGDLYVTMNDYTNSLKAISDAKEVFTKELGLNDETTAQCKQWVTGLQNLLQRQVQQRSLSQTQNAVNTGVAATSKKPKAAKKAEKVDPELANKSVDELMSYIEGGSKTKSKGGKKTNKKN
ncbi:LANO_0D04456g1_1 [Lachancea nothofagi CBS 11611]|uniref:LANO_0D04456g1_1 n=1 Tax=Lachancea nothofagi CBS 11611 TaxID=1266666 RepID=A0A1G4JG69_9SACH|nr:LANO_0D04456g1_1 [Lachancea nothofagi CBS 11611]